MPEFFSFCFFLMGVLDFPGVLLFFFFLFGCIY